MTSSEWIQAIAGGATVLLLVAAAAGDLARYKISNRISIAVAVAFAVSALFSGSWIALGWSLVAAVAVFAVSCGLFALGLFGGGDVKLLTAMALWTGLVDLLPFLLIMSLAGGLLGIVWWLLRRRQIRRVNADGTGMTGDSPSLLTVPNKLPYGAAIAFGGLHFFATSAHSPFAHLLPWLS